jgi:hypothetical protein
MPMAVMCVQRISRRWAVTEIALWTAVSAWRAKASRATQAAAAATPAGKSFRRRIVSTGLLKSISDTIDQVRGNRLAPGFVVTS